MIGKLTRTIVRTFAFALALCATSGAWATPTATAVWRSNLGDSYKIGGVTYGITPSSGTLNEDGTITAPGTWTTAAPYIDLEGKGIDTISILVKYSGLNLATIYEADEYAIGVAFASILDSDNNVIGSHVAKNDAAKSLRVYHCGASANEATQKSIGNTTVVEGSGYLLFSYSHSSGTRAYMGTSIVGLTGGEDTGSHWSDKTLKKLVIGGDISGKAWDCANFKIEEVALFVNQYLSSSDVADYVFPDITVATETELTMTELNNKVAGLNGSQLYFSAANPIVTYDTAPSAATQTFLQSANWSGTVWIKDQTMTEFQPGIYGNANSTLRLSGVYCYFPQNHTCNVPVELSYEGTTRGYGMNVYNGYSRDASTNRIIKFAKIKGDGELWTSSGAGTVTMQVCDWSEFTGKFQFVNKILVLGDTVPAFNSLNTAGSIYICEGKSVRIASGKQWRADGGIRIAGELRADGVTSTTFKSDTRLTTENNGVLTLISNSNTDDLDVNYSMVGGTGTIRFEGTNYRTISRSNFPTGLICDNRLSGNGFIHRVPNGTMTIGSLKGDGRIRSDWGGSGSTGDRDLKVLQAKDTEYSGLFDQTNDRIKDFIVAPGESTSGTLTLSGTQTTSNGLKVESGAKVNLTGTWVGDTTVAGTFGGTGTLTGGLTMSDDSTFKASATDSNGLSVSGTPSWSGTVTVDVSDIAASITSSGVTLITSTGNITSETDISALSVTSGYFLKAETDVLKVYPLAATVNDANTGDVLQSFATVGEALTYAGAGLTPYARYVVVMADATVESSVAPVLIDADGVTLNLTYSGLEYQYSSSPTGVGNIYYYQKVDKAADYTWDEDAADNQWGTAASWVVGGDTATRPPRNAGDTVTFESDETVTLSTAITIKELNIASAVMLTATGAAIEGGESVNFSVTDGISLTSAGASLTVRSVNLSTPPTTDVEGYYVKETTGSGTTTYTVTAIVASVTDSGSNVTNYDSLATAVSSASTGDSIALFANSSEAITLNNKTINFSEGSYTFSGSFTGNGTLIMTALPKSLATTLWSEGWTGTLWLKNVTFPVIESGADAGKSIVNPVVFGNANSTLRLTSCSGGFGDDWTYDENEDKFPGTLDLVDENDAPAFSVTSGWPAYGKTVFAKLTGTGTLTSGNPSKAHYYQILDASEFRGTITIPSNDKFRVGIGNVDASLNNGSSIADKTLTIQTGASATIAAGKNWTAAGGFIIDGTLTIESNDALSSKAVKGGGTVVYRAAPNSETISPSFDASLWTGTVELPSYSLGGEKFNKYGNSNSTVKINGYSSWLDWTEKGNPNKSRQNPTLNIVGTLNITALSAWDYIFDSVTGTGAIVFPSGTPNSITISKLTVPEGFNGVCVTNRSSTAVAISKLVLPSIPPSDTKVLAVGGSGVINLNLSDIKVGVGEDSLPAKYKLQRRHVGEEGDGFYVYYNGTIFSVY